MGTALAGAALLVLAGCVPGGGPEPAPTDSAEPTAGATPKPDPVLDLTGPAELNKPYFDMVAQRLIDAGGAPGGREFVDALVQGGFPKEALEVTPDRTAIDGAADSVQFSVKLNGGCLIGQYGNVGYASTTGDVLATDRCLVGQTRPIDW